LAIANDLAVLIFSDTLFHTFAASMVKLFLARAGPNLIKLLGAYLGA